MTSVLDTPTDQRVEHVRIVPARWQRWALVAICAVAAVLYGWGLWSWGWGNSYYTAAVRSMSASLENFLFGAFDQAGVVTVDKPPFSLWPQAVSTWIFGFHGWSVLLPQAVIGVGTVFLLHRTVRLWMGENAALLAALVLALTPVTVAIDRNNNPDTLLVLFLVGAAYALTRAVHGQAGTASATSWLLVAVFLVGCGFNTKMVAAWMIVPAMLLAYLMGSTASWRRRLADLSAAGVVLLASSLWWVALVDLWPGEKPYIGGSADGSAWNLVIGYNGLGRLLGLDSPIGGALAGGGLRAGMPDQFAGGGGGRGGMDGMMSMLGGATGPDRLFNSAIGGQISWLLPLALLSLGAVAVGGVLARRRGASSVPARRAGWALWGGWLLCTGVTFSFAGMIHPYYTTALAPAIAALVGGGAVLAWRAHRRGRIAGRVVAAVGVLVTVVWAAVLVAREPDWHGWAGPAALAVGVLAVLALTVPAVRRVLTVRGTVALSVLAVLLVPAVWSAATAFGPAPANASLPAAGPQSSQGMAWMPRTGTAPNQAGSVSRGPAGNWTNSGELDADQRLVLDYAAANSEGVRMTLAIDGGAMVAANFVLGTDMVVVSFGGFMGSDPAPTVEQLSSWASSGELRYVLRPGGIPRFMTGATGDSVAARRTAWVRQNCTEVPPAAYGDSHGTAGALYDCGIDR